jgi:cell pole-organizing protein PopZ
MPPTLYPGAGLPPVLQDLHVEKLYAIGAHRDCFGSFSYLLPIREVFMMAAMDACKSSAPQLLPRRRTHSDHCNQTAVTDKPNWHEKVFDDAIVAKWRKEAMEQPEDELYARIVGVPPGDFHKAGLPKPRARILSDKAFDNCIAELRSKAALCKETGLVYTLDAVDNTVIKSDHTLVSEELHRRLADAFAELRSAQAANVDWHPWTDDKVQDLVHPSLYPFVFGQKSLSCRVYPA